MKIEQARELDMVDFLSKLGYEPAKVKGDRYWYLSPFRAEHEPSFVATPSAEQRFTLDIVCTAIFVITKHLKKDAMKWEDLKVYRPLSKEELKPAFREFTNIIAHTLKGHGFLLRGRKLVRQSNDLLQVIHIDTRGSWMGISERFETEVALVALSDKSPFFDNAELSGRKRIETIAVGIRDHSRITKEYPLLAEFLTRKMISSVLPYFDKYCDSKMVLNAPEAFKTGNLLNNNDDLILFCELQNKINRRAETIVNQKISHLSALNSVQGFNDRIEDLLFYQKALKESRWEEITQKIIDNQLAVVKKIRLNSKK